MADVRAMASAPVVLGEALCAARLRVGYSVDAVANLVSLRSDQIYEVEAGLYEPSVSVIETLASIYGIQADQLPRNGQTPRAPLRYEATKNLLHAGWLTMEFDPSRHTNDDLLRGFASCIRQLRGESTSAPIILREADRDMLARLLNLDDEHLDQRFAHWFGCPLGQFAGIRQTLAALR